MGMQAASLENPTPDKTARRDKRARGAVHVEHAKRKQQRHEFEDDDDEGERKNEDNLWYK